MLYFYIIIIINFIQFNTIQYNKIKINVIIKLLKLHFYFFNLIAFNFVLIKLNSI